MFRGIVLAVVFSIGLSSGNSGGGYAASFVSDLATESAAGTQNSDGSGENVSVVDEKELREFLLEKEQKMK
ncbi:MAG: hypothetical protein LBI29_00165 [Rickettsiales bacterium]|jgi:hypothetical protein|nr:hypothetical protein [Rickettsiales bacterium]